MTIKQKAAPCGIGRPQRKPHAAFAFDSRHMRAPCFINALENQVIRIENFEFVMAL